MSRGRRELIGHGNFRRIHMLNVRGSWIPSTRAHLSSSARDLLTTIYEMVSHLLRALWKSTAFKNSIDYGGSPIGADGTAVYCLYYLRSFRAARALR